MLNGTIDCAVQKCIGVTFGTFLSFADSAKLSMYGGRIDWGGWIDLFDTSEAHFFGANLTATPTSGLGDSNFLITGTLANGDELGLRVFKHPGARIVLHNIPEPAAWIQILTALGLLIAIDRRFSHRLLPKWHTIDSPKDAYHRAQTQP